MRAGRDGGEGGEARAADASAHGFVFGAAPRDDPLTYPGAHPSWSYLFTGTAIERLDEVDVDGIAGAALRARLRMLGATPMARRQPVLAYGSNRSPAQLASKFAAGSVDAVIPVVRVDVVGASVVFAAAVAWYGSVPAALEHDPGARTEAAVTFLDEGQLRVVDASEGGHSRPEVDHARHAVRLRSGAVLDRCQSYRSTRPVLTWDGRPIRLREVASVDSDLAAWSQAELHEVLLGLWRERVAPFAGVAELVEAVRGDPGVLRAVNATLRDLEATPFGRLGARSSAGWG